MELAEGQVIGDRYRVVEPIGFGGAGDVYRVVDERMGAERALKLLYEDQLATSVIRQRFLVEARIMADLSHPNVLPVYALGEHEQRVYFVMEFATKGSVRELFRKRGPQPRLAVEVTLQALQGLAYAHEAGCIHRDVKPANVLVFDDDRCKLTDFGVARYDAIGVARHTRTGDYLGTLGYMPPEQRADPRSVEPRSDIYAAGAMLYTLLSNRTRPPPDLYALAIDDETLPGVPGAVRAVVERATRSRADDRFPDALEMVRALDDALQVSWG